MKKILILDDDTDVLDILQTILEEENYDVKIVEETNEIFQIVHAYQPDLILSDFSLKGLNGGEICQQLKNSKETSSLPIILTSAYHKTFLHPEKFGCDDFIAKPFDLYDLLDRIKDLLELKIAGAKINRD